MDKVTRERQIEIVFIAIFSVLILIIFYTLISMNGVVLGNDPAVHLEKISNLSPNRKNTFSKLRLDASAV